MEDADIDPQDLRIEAFSSVPSRPDEPSRSAIKVTHLPSGHWVFVDQFDDHKANRAEAMKRLRRKLG